MAVLHFRLEYTVRKLTIPSSVALTFEYGGPHEVKVMLRAPSDEERAKGHSSSNAFCTASSAVEPNEKVHDVFMKIAANQMITVDNDISQVALEYSTPDGSRVHLPALSDFPQNFLSFVQNVRGELADWAVRTVSVLRWRADVPGPHNPISSRGFYWSVDEAFWHPAPGDLGLRVDTFRVLRLPEELRAVVDNIVRCGGSAPLHDDLFREAWEQRYENPRSALLIGIAAAELSVKHCISTLVPDAKWLVTNLPTPPLVKMLSEYLPKLPARCKLDGQVKPPPAQVIDLLSKGVTIRNQLSHAGASNPSTDDVEEILLAVRDVLWLIDFYVGSEWALGFVSPETRDRLSAA